MKTILIGNGYWGNIIKPKLEKYTDLIEVLNSKSDIDSILSIDNDIDMVFICVPTISHYDLVKKCIEHKKNIFCEKPFTGDYEKAKELYELADSFGVSIFVDNIFLYRKEIIDNSLKIKKGFINFIWNKPNDGYKESLYDSLLYHDLYLLISLSGINKWEIISNYISEDNLKLVLYKNDIISEFKYNRNYELKDKRIIINSDVIFFDKAINDPLNDIINNIKNYKIDYSLNKKETLDTLYLLTNIKNINY
jgi:hypothetical protein